MAKKIVTFDNNGHSGISVAYDKENKKLIIDGWFDNVCGIRGGEISLTDFLARLCIAIVEDDEE